MTAWPEPAWCIYAVNQNNVYYIDNQKNLWLTTAPWTTTTRQLVDSQVMTFRPVIGSELTALYVQTTDGSVWYETGPWAAGHVKQLVDTNVWYYDGNVTLGQLKAYVGDSSGNLWLAQGPWGGAQTRQKVDGNVSCFQCLDDATVFVKGEDGNLWLEHAPWGDGIPTREHIDGSVAYWQAMSIYDIYVLGTDRNLWLEIQPQGNIAGHRVQVDSNVGSFQALNTAQAFVTDRQGNLRLETASVNGTWGQSKTLIETSVSDCHALNEGCVFVVHSNDHTLWLETSPWSSPPQPNRQLIAADLGPVAGKPGPYIPPPNNHGGDVDP